jgi:DNA-binding NtrC family response regulator
LFGHRKGAFTGANQEHKGFFIEAGQGTLLLDEIGELPLALQGKLLRVIENGEFYRVGDTQQLTSRARIVAATNKVLRDEVAEGNFRADLYHRLSILNVNMPALRERNGDSFLLLDHFVATYADSVAPFELDDEAKMLWGSYAFPGNIRELRNIVIRLGTKYPGEKITRTVLEAEMETQLSASELSETSHVLSDELIKQKLVSGEFSLDGLLDEVESRCIRIALEINNNKVSKAADALQVNRTTLYSRVQKLGKL